MSNLNLGPNLEDCKDFCITVCKPWLLITLWHQQGWVLFLTRWSSTFQNVLGQDYIAEQFTLHMQNIVAFIYVIGADLAFLLGNCMWQSNYFIHTNWFICVKGKLAQNLSVIYSFENRPPAFLLRWWKISLYREHNLQKCIPAD